MITTTLAQLPGNRPYEAVGVVIGIVYDSPRSNGREAALRQLEAQAEGLGADAIIDVRLQMEVIDGNPATLAIALIGTAIKFVQRVHPEAAHVAG